MLQKQINKLQRQRRIRSKISGTADRPRLAVFKSGMHVYAQLIDDSAHKTLASASDLKLEKMTGVEKATAVGKDIAEKAKKLKLSNVVFDRGGFLYHGKVKALADAAREGGMTF